MPGYADVYNPARRVSASPKWSSFTPMRSMIAQIQAAQLAVVVAGVEVVERRGRSCSVPPRPPASDHRQLHVVVLPAGPHVREQHQAAVVEHRAFAFGHRVELLGQIGKLAQMEARDALVAVGQIVVRGRVMPFAHVEERIIERRKIAAPAAARRCASCRSETPAR